MGTRIASICCSIKGENDHDDGLTRILIFGITGMTGGAVAEGVMSSNWYKVSGFTRRDCGEVYEEIKSKGVNLITGDMLHAETLHAAMVGIDVIFLNTFYWDFMDPLVELKQGTNVVDVAMEHGVKHIIYAGTDYNTLTAQVRCPYLEGKAMVTDYIISVGIPYTIVRMGFYYENFISVFRPHPMTKSKYAITLPLQSIPINCGSIHDFGRCIACIGVRPGMYAFTVIHLASEYLSIPKIVQSFNKRVPLDKKFVDGKVSLKAYKSFNFRGSQELTAMFSHYRTQLQWDSFIMRALVAQPQTLDDWLEHNAKILQTTLDDVYQDVLAMKEGIGIGIAQDAMHKVTFADDNIPSLISKAPNLRCYQPRGQPCDGRSAMTLSDLVYVGYDRNFTSIPGMANINRIEMTLYSLGIFMNATLLVSLIAFRDLRKLPGAKYVIAVIVTSLMILLTVLLRSISRELGILLKPLICNTVRFLFDFFLSASIYCRLFAAIDRLMYISDPLRYHKKMTGLRTAFLISVAWLLSFSLAFMTSVSYTIPLRNRPFTIDHVRCNRSDHGGTFEIISISSMYMIPSIAVCAIYINIACLAYQQIKDVHARETYLNFLRNRASAPSQIYVDNSSLNLESSPVMLSLPKVNTNDVFYRRSSLRRIAHSLRKFFQHVTDTLSNVVRKQSTEESASNLGLQKSSVYSISNRTPAPVFSPIDSDVIRADASRDSEKRPLICVCCKCSKKSHRLESLPDVDNSEKTPDLPDTLSEALRTATIENQPPVNNPAVSEATVAAAAYAVAHAINADDNDDNVTAAASAVPRAVDADYKTTKCVSIVSNGVEFENELNHWRTQRATSSSRRKVMRNSEATESYWESVKNKFRKWHKQLDATDSASILRGKKEGSRKLSNGQIGLFTTKSIIMASAFNEIPLDTYSTEGELKFHSELFCSDTFEKIVEFESQRETITFISRRNASLTAGYSPTTSPWIIGQLSKYIPGLKMRLFKLFLVIVFIIACNTGLWLPFMIAHSIRLLGWVKVPDLTIMILNDLGLMTNIMDPVVFGAMNIKFRQLIAKRCRMFATRHMFCSFTDNQ